MFKIIVDPKASKEMEKLSAKLQKQISQKINQAMENPGYFFKKLGSRTDYKLRVGKYRVIADIDFVEQKITITFVGHRKNVYEKI